MNNVVTVKMWGTIIGYLGYPKNSNVAVFEYDENFTKSGIQVSPITMNYPSNRFTFENISKRTFVGIPGVFADSLPDKFGNQLIDQFMAQKNILKDDITSLSRLLYVGNRGMGALEYIPSEFIDDLTAHKKLDLSLLSQLAELVVSRDEKFRKKLNDSETKEDALNLIRVGSSAGGARSKALIAKDNDGNLYDGTKIYAFDATYWLLKFDSGSNKDRDGSDPKGMTRVEFIFGLIAKKCNINMPNIDYIEIGDDFNFLIERFDREFLNGRIVKKHYVSWAGMEHFDRDTTGAYSYEQLVMTARQLELGQNEITEIFRRAIFNIVGRNQDDHTKNFGFVMDRKGKWELSPAFDMTYSYDPTGKWSRSHQIKLNNKQDDFRIDDILKFGMYCNIKVKDINKILDLTKESFKEFKNLSTQYNIDEDLKNTIENNLLLNL